MTILKGLLLFSILSACGAPCHQGFDLCGSECVAMGQPCDGGPLNEDAGPDGNHMTSCHACACQGDKNDCDAAVGAHFQACNTKCLPGDPNFTTCQNDCYAAAESGQATCEYVFQTCEEHPNSCGCDGGP